MGQLLYRWIKNKYWSLPNLPTNSAESLCSNFSSGHLRAPWAGNGQLLTSKAPQNSSPNQGTVEVLTWWYGSGRWSCSEALVTSLWGDWFWSKSRLFKLFFRCHLFNTCWCDLGWVCYRLPRSVILQFNVCWYKLFRKNMAFWWVGPSDLVIGC